MLGTVLRKFALFSALAALTACSSATPPDGMVRVPKGKFTMGSNEVDKEAKAVQYGDRRPWYANERPERTEKLKEFHIDATEVTNRQFMEFLAATGRPAPPHWMGGSYQAGLDDHPVVMVTWNEADEFCRWKGKRLPTEAEWEKAARGTDGRRFPWGDDFDLKKVNTLGAYNGTLPVGSLKDGASPYGAMDMAGNAQEWTADWYKPYPGNDFKDKDYGERFKVVRGGGWGGMGHYSLQVYVRAAFRNAAPPQGRFDDLGFRCAWQG
ncbi:MAG: SUMF1/EgtB/PvdO family nonheme iron enzyme [Deltaproteobacteria bacterium]|nr:SUMF1/EgtB/PvdO family nonheme iron enzyme [Deltaproteobacteria bacterium]MCL4874000.1 formylglycine-generating enzyme family protein [bacterium]